MTLEPRATLPLGNECIRWDWRRSPVPLAAPARLRDRPLMRPLGASQAHKLDKHHVGHRRTGQGAYHCEEC